MICKKVFYEENDLTASQAAASAAWGQTWEIRIPVCSAIDSGEVNLACEEMWDVLGGERSVKNSVKWSRIEQEKNKPGVQQLRRCTLRRRARSWPRQGRGWQRAGKPGQTCKSFITFDFYFSSYVSFTLGSFEKFSQPSF